jgi:hypothetical protein
MQSKFYKYCTMARIYTKNRVWFVNQTRYPEETGKGASIYTSTGFPDLNAAAAQPTQAQSSVSHNFTIRSETSLRAKGM